MALYLGDGKKYKIVIAGVTYCLYVGSAAQILAGTVMLSSDGYILVDSNGLYITAKEND